MPGHSNTRGLNLPVGNPGSFQSLQPVLAKADGAPAISYTTHSASHLFAMLNFFRHQHDDLSLRPFWSLSTCARWSRPAFSLTWASIIHRIRTGPARHGRIGIQNLTAIDPNLDSDHPKSRVRFGKAIVNIR